MVAEADWFVNSGDRAILCVCMDSVDEVLAGLKEQQQKLAAELARVERAIAALEGSLDGTLVAAADVEPRPYAAMTLYEATAYFLAYSKEPRTSREIADALRAGGFKTRSAKFASIVATMLARKDARLYGIRRTRNGNGWTYRRWRTAQGSSKPTS